MKKQLQLLMGVISHLLLTSPSLSQENVVTIYGTVIDDLNQTIPLSTVVLLKNNQIEAGIITDENGNFILGDVKSGIYDLKISSIGFSSKYIRNVQIERQDLRIPAVQLGWGIHLSSVTCTAWRPFCNKACGYGCICECCAPEVEFSDSEPEGHVGSILQIDTLNYLSLESWRDRK